MRFAASPAALNAFGAVSDTSIDFNQLAGMGQESQSLQKRTAFDSESKLKQAADQAEAMVEAAKYGTQATRAAGSAAGQASMFGGIMSGIGSIAGAIPTGGGGGGSPLAFDSSNISASSYQPGGFTVGGMTPSQMLASPNINYSPFGR